MPSPFEVETVIEPDVVITYNARKLPDVVVSTIARAIPVVAFTEVAFTKDPPWLRRLAVSGGVHNIDGLWRRTVQVFTTSKTHVDSVCPIFKTAFVYYDDEVYDSVLTEKKTGITYVTQLVFDSETRVYYVYYRWGETDYELNGPHETIESAKEALQITYKEKFNVEWTEREINTSEGWVYEVKTYETFEEIKEVEEIIEESDAEIINARDKDIVVEDTKITEETTAIVTEEEVTLEHVTKETVVVEQMEEQEEEAIKEVVIQKETGVVAKSAVPEKASCALTGVGATVVGAGAIAGGAVSGAFTKVDGVWKRTVQVLTTRKAKVDHVCPLSKTAYVYYDDEVYDSVLTEKSTGITYVTQLIFDSQTNVYYVYYRWGETDYKLDGPHETIEFAKEAFQVTYKEKFDVEWTERETTTSEKWTYEVKTYETFEEIEEIEEIVEETEVQTIIGREQGEHTDTNETTQTTETITESGEVVLEHVTKEVVVVEETEKEVVIKKDDVVVVGEKAAVDEEKEVVVEEKEVAVEKTTVVVDDKEEVVIEETKEITVEETVKEVVITKETGKVAKPAVPEKASWFRRAISGAEAAALVTGAGAVAVGVAAGAAQGEVNYPLVLEKTRSLAGGKKGGSAGLSTTAIAAVIGAAQM